MSAPDVTPLLEAFRADLAAASSTAELDEVKRRHTGKKSALKGLFKQLRSVPDDERPAVAQSINDAQAQMESELERAQETVAEREIAARIEMEWMDLTLPGVAPRRGARHPITEVEAQSMAMLRRLGFEVREGPEVESPHYNFDALNIPEHHPARDMQDTFWVDGDLVLRTHTTSVQARVLSQKPELPVRVASFGRVYRNEAVDANHLAMFHQFEGIWVDYGLTFAHLKGVLRFIVQSIYGADRPMRFKPKYYPYTEPSVGVDVATDVEGPDGTVERKWNTILGAGMVHPKMLIGFGYDPDQVGGIAFGLGTSRMAAQRGDVPYLRALYEGDLRLHHQLHRGGA